MHVEEATRRAGGHFVPNAGGYGSGLLAAVSVSTGAWLLTMEAGLAHSPYIIPEIYARRNDADIVIASRFLQTGYDNSGWLRRVSSRLANRVVGWVLDFQITDLSSSFRLYRRHIFDEAAPKLPGHDSLLEVLVRAHTRGFRMLEVPFHYFPVTRNIDRRFGDMAAEWARSLFPLWRLRNSIESADYDERAFRSRIWFQRSWQRKRYHILVDMIRNVPTILDVGCGSSQVLEGLPQADGCDVRLNKLRWKRGRSRFLLRASVFNLPFRTESYEAVIFSQVIEHLPRDPCILAEIVRVVRPGGLVIVGTPDYNTWWTVIEKIYGLVHPDGYADEHITHYTARTLKAEVEAFGCTLIDHAYVYHAELIMRFQKHGSS